MQLNARESAVYVEADTGLGRPACKYQLLLAVDWLTL
jgi:hypothetical protein